MRRALFLFTLIAILLLPQEGRAHAFLHGWPPVVSFASPPENELEQDTGPVEGIAIVTNNQEYDFRAPLYLSDFLSKNLTNGPLPDVGIKIVLKKGIRITQVIPKHIDMLFDIRLNGESCKKVFGLGDYCATMIGWLHHPIAAPPPGTKYDQVKGQKGKLVVAGNDRSGMARSIAVGKLNVFSQKTIFPKVQVYAAIKTDKKTGAKYIFYRLEQDVLLQLRENRDLIQNVVKGLALDVRASGSKKIIFSRVRNQGLGQIRP